MGGVGNDESPKRGERSSLSEADTGAMIDACLVVRWLSERFGSDRRLKSSLGPRGLNIS